MTVKKITVERVTFVSKRSFEDVLGLLDMGIGRPNFREIQRQMAEASSHSAFEKIIHGAVGTAGLMEFMRLDLGMALRKDPAVAAYKIVRIIAGNPLIMKQMVEHVPHAGSYAPVTILVYESEDKVHICYDTMESLLNSYPNGPALEVARDLDSKVIKLLQDAAG